MGRFFLSQSLKGTILLQIFSIVLKKVFRSSFHYAATRGGASKSKPTFRSSKGLFHRPRLPSPLFYRPLSGIALEQKGVLLKSGRTPLVLLAEKLPLDDLDISLFHSNFALSTVQEYDRLKSPSPFLNSIDAAVETPCKGLSFV